MNPGLLDHNVGKLRIYRMVSLTLACAVSQAHVQPVLTAHTTTTATRARSALPVRVATAAAAGPARQRVGPVAPAHGTLTQTRRRHVFPAQTARHVGVDLVLHPAASLATKLVICRECYQK
jgi:hypothetical protein